MYKCIDCGKVFEEPKSEYIEDMLGIGLMFEKHSNKEAYMCPFCDGNFEECYQCECCGEYYTKEELEDNKCIFCRGEEE